MHALMFPSSVMALCPSHSLIYSGCMPKSFLEVPLMYPLLILVFPISIMLNALPFPTPTMDV